MPVGKSCRQMAFVFSQFFILYGNLQEELIKGTILGIVRRFLDGCTDRSFVNVYSRVSRLVSARSVGGAGQGSRGAEGQKGGKGKPQQKENTEKVQENCTFLLVFGGLLV